MNLDAYAILAMQQAQAASAAGTFGTGAVLMDTEGHILCKARSRVIRGSRVNDPTAHCERQLVDWYLNHKEADSLPAPENCILIASLDPCVMCTGALAEARFGKVIVISPDDYAGINWEGTDACRALDGLDFQAYVKAHYAYPAVRGSLSRAAYGADLSDIALFSESTVSSETLRGCRETFLLTADAMREKVSAAAVDIREIKNPALLAPSHPIRRYLASAFGSDFAACSLPGDLSAKPFLQYIERARPGFRGVAYFDSFGNLLFLAEDDARISTESAFMQVTRRIAAVRNTAPIEGYEINEYLSHPKYGYFVYTHCPALSAKTCMELGAIGSTLENTSVRPIWYIYGAERQAALEAFIAKLPPLYTRNINIRFQQLPPAE